MKYIKTIVIILAVIASSCEQNMLLTRDDVPFAPWVTFDPGNNIIDAGDLDGSPVTGTFDAPSQNVASHAINVRRIYNAGSDTSEYVLLETITAFPTEWEVSASDLADAFGISLDDAYGDLYEFDCVSTGTDGREVVFENIDGDIVGSSGQLQGYQFTAMYVCPSDPSLIVGTYNCISNGVSTDTWITDPNAVNVEYVVTISETDREGYYEISDFSCGVYLFWYWEYGLDAEITGTIQDICGVYQFVETVDIWGGTQWASVLINGDGTITIEGINVYADTWTSELTKQN